MAYRPRIVDFELNELMGALPAVALSGAKGVGKTATATQRARTALPLDDPSTAALAGADPARALQGPAPALLDEWQRVPELWDFVRRAVDAGATPGQSLLTGSAAPAVGTTHSGAGRIRPHRLPAHASYKPRRAWDDEPDSFFDASDDDCFP